MENIIYKGTFITENQTKFYVGSTGLSFKNRYTKHKFSLEHEKHRNATTLSHYIGKQKNNKVNFKINWEILTKIQSCPVFKIKRGRLPSSHFNFGNINNNEK